MSLSLDKRVSFDRKGARIDGILVSIPNIRLVKALESGANGIVFEALDTMLKRRVAVKIWLPKPGDSRDKFRQGAAEARKIAQLKHSSIVEVYSAGELPNRMFYTVMEFLEGASLHRYLLAEDPDLSQRYKIWWEISEGIHYAHDRGVYHGDLHDRNVLVSGAHARIIDFGTSMFSRERREFRARESRLLVEMVRILVKERDVVQYQSVDIASLPPEKTLLACNAWMELVYREVELRRRLALVEDDDYEPKHAGFGFSVILGECPVFDLPKIVDWISAESNSKSFVSNFLDGLYGESLRIAADNRYRGDVRYDEEEPVEAKLSRLMSPYEKLTSSFLEKKV